MSQEQNPLGELSSSTPNIHPDVAKKLQNDPAVSAFGVRQGKLHVWLHPPTQDFSEQQLKKLLCSRLGWVDPPAAVIFHSGSWVVKNTEITQQEELTEEQRDRARRKYIRSLRGKYTSD
jgi:hypothetical protein